MRWPRKHVVLGVGVSTTSYGEVVDLCREWIRDRREGPAVDGASADAVPGPYICVTSVHGIVTAVNQPDFRSVLNGAAIVTPDGMPVVWALRSFGVAGQTRVYGPDLMLAMCERAAAEGQRIFLYGARASTLDTLAENLTKRFPKLIIAGTFAPPFRALTEEEDAECVEMIRKADPDILFVGMSTPKQDAWMAAHTSKLPGILMAGVGAAFDFHAGRVRQAPLWMRQAGLEWFFRFWMEPKRLWRRYLLETPLFVPLWALQKMNILRYDSMGLKGRSD